MDQPLILQERQGRVALVRLNRPAQLNALNDALMDALGAALRALDADDGVGAIVLTGNDKAFAAGADIAAMAEATYMDVYQSSFITRNWEAIRQVRKPVLAAVAGFALGGGCELALACDLIVAAESARFGLPEVKRGLAAAAGGLLRLPKILPYQLAMEIAITGDPLSATVAHHHGLVNRLAEPGHALTVARELAARVAANGPLAVRATKQVLAMSAKYTDPDAFVAQREFIDPVFTSRDAKEGATAFAEKRSPVWSGS